MKKIKIIVSILVLSSNALIAQTYVSPKQRTTTNGFADRVETELVKKIIIDENSFHAGLPDGDILSGSIELFRTIERDNEKRTVYKIVSGGILSINDDLEDDNWDSIVINLLATSKKKVYTFWLTKGNKGDD
ncbi:hypothetical protein ACFSQJ_19805 [Croceitalea marina]|uniref:PLAT domain-containing protein n=1 Tax=Croceitalea marina TaxID=1775166 RepID=A0ABW5N4Z2_9FLAO